MKVVVAGGTGFIGGALVGALADAGHRVVVFTRRRVADAPSIPEFRQWDANTFGPWGAELNGADAVLNLAGESLGGRRWSRTQKHRIVTSRIRATKALVDAIRQAKRRPSVLVNISTVGYYGSVAEGEVDEQHPPGNDFLAALCRQWETEALAAESLGTRVVLPRVGLVLGKGGALQRLALPFKFFLGGTIGSGRQWVSWVHRDDLVSALMFLLDRREISGAVNLVAPESARMEQLCSSLGDVLRRPSWLRVPDPVLRIALGEMAGMLITGQRVIPARLVESGYQFIFPTLRHALHDCLKPVRS